jgi:hypothetical protein
MEDDKIVDEKNKQKYGSVMHLASCDVECCR